MSNRVTLFELPVFPGKESDEWATPQPFFLEQHARFGFTIDAASTPQNAKLPRRLRDGLLEPWAGERVWCNPPYSNPEPWCRKAADEIVSGCELVVMLLPVDTSTDWYHDWILPYAEVVFLRKRLTFMGAADCARFASMLAIYRAKEIA